MITAGDYQEDEQEFAQLLEDLREQSRRWAWPRTSKSRRSRSAKMWAVRYEHGAIQHRTGDMRAREKVSHARSFESAPSYGATLERASRGIEYVIDTLEAVKEEALAGPCLRCLRSGSTAIP